jgi:hypothetical protein
MIPNKTASRAEQDCKRRQDQAVIHRFCDLTENERKPRRPLKSRC